MAYTLSKEYVWKEVGDKIVVLHLDSGHYYSLNTTGSFIWKSIMDGQSPQQIAMGLCDAFEIDEKTAKKDTDETIHDLLNRKFITDG